MTITAAVNRTSAAGNGVTTAFATPKFLADADLVVLLVNNTTGAGVTQTLATNYTLAGAGADPGGTVTMVVPPASGETLVIYSDPPITQSLDLVDNGPMPAASYERALDRLTLIGRRIKEIVTRGLYQPDSDAVDIGALPNKATRAGKYLGFDGNGDPVATAGTGDPSVVSTFMQTLLDDTSASAGRTTLGATATGSSLFTAANAAAGRSALSLGTMAVENVTTTTKGDLLTRNSTVLARLGVGADGQVLSALSSEATGLVWAGPIRLGTAQASTSGTAIDFTSIPSGVKRITIMFAGVSLNGTAAIRIQLGDSGGIENSGYVGATMTVLATATAAVGTAGMDMPSYSTGNQTFHGTCVLNLADAATSTWVGNYNLGVATGDAVVGGYHKALSATLDRVRITTVAGTATFDAGSINIQYEF